MNIDDSGLKFYSKEAAYKKYVVDTRKNFVSSSDLCKGKEHIPKASL